MHVSGKDLTPLLRGKTTAKREEWLTKAKSKVVLTKRESPAITAGLISYISFPCISD